MSRTKELDPGQLDSTLRQLGKVTARLTAEDILQLLARRDAGGEGGEVVGAVIEHMADEDVAQFVAGSVIAERGATARLAHAFQALVPDADRRRGLLALAEEQVAGSTLGAEASFDELWGKVESMVTSYSDANYVSDDYARELWSAQTNPVAVEQFDRRSARACLGLGIDGQRPRAARPRPPAPPGSSRDRSGSGPMA